MTHVRAPGDALASLLVGVSACMSQLRGVVAQLAQSRLPVLILGPTGAGKELVANAVHLASARKGGFVAFNVSALADTMFEDALFGHARGAFTGATGDTTGYLAEADKGTIFLDEISGLGLPSQAKLLRAIETQSFRPVGASRDKRSDFRIVAATNDDLLAQCDRALFRPDLYHRLAGVTVHVPSLAERREDIPVLMQAFLRSLSDDAAIVFTAGALETFGNAEWPGNVRQLKHAVELAFTNARRFAH